MNNLEFSYIEVHKAWLHIPTSSLIFLHELDTRTDDEIHELVFERCGVRSTDLQLNPSDWLIWSLKHPYEVII